MTHSKAPCDHHRLKPVNFGALEVYLTEAQDRKLATPAL
jgi:hypothetical protein